MAPSLSRSSRDTFVDLKVLTKSYDLPSRFLFWTQRTDFGHNSLFGAVSKCVQNQNVSKTRGEVYARRSDWRGVWKTTWLTRLRNARWWNRWGHDARGFGHNWTHWTQRLLSGLCVQHIGLHLCVQNMFTMFFGTRSPHDLAEYYSLSHLPKYKIDLMISFREIWFWTQSSILDRFSS